MKYNNKADKILLEVTSKDLSKREFKIFIAWFTDSKSFNPSNQVIADRTGISMSHISKTFISLVNKNILILKGGHSGSSTKKKINIYDLHPSILKDSPVLKEKEAEIEVIQPIAQPSLDIYPDTSIPNLEDCTVNLGEL